jgi:hypothetical protein
VWVPAEKNLNIFLSTDINAFKCMLSDIFH